MKKSLTIADIADALHLSRNTVSKALNGKHVSPKTKQLILDTAVQMGYKSFDLISSSGAGGGPAAPGGRQHCEKGCENGCPLLK